MGQGGSGDFHERERRSARAFAEMAAREGVGRIVYLAVDAARRASAWSTIGSG
jgi:hypothetical protein